MRMILLLLGLLVALPLSSRALVVAGTGDSEELLQRLGAEFSRHNPQIEVSVPPSVGSSGGVRMLLEGRTDLARVARPLKPAEARQGLHWRAFALVPILFVANLPRTCVSDISSRQVVEIFAGRLTNWSQLGDCPSAKIYLARREEGDSSNRVLKAQIAGLDEIKQPVGRTIYTTPEAFETITRYPYTLGYLPETELLSATLVRLSFNGVVANAETVASRRYPLQQILALAWRDPLRPAAAKFLAFLATPTAQKIIREFGAVPVPLKGF